MHGKPRKDGIILCAPLLTGIECEAGAIRLLVSEDYTIIGAGANLVKKQLGEVHFALGLKL